MTPEDPDDTYGDDDTNGSDEDVHSDDWGDTEYDEEDGRYGDDRDDD